MTASAVTRIAELENLHAHVHHTATNQADVFGGGAGQIEHELGVAVGPPVVHTNVDGSAAARVCHAKDRAKGELGVSCGEVRRCVGLTASGEVTGEGVVIVGRSSAKRAQGPLVLESISQGGFLEGSVGFGWRLLRMHGRSRRGRFGSWGGFDGRRRWLGCFVGIGYGNPRRPIDGRAAAPRREGDQDEQRLTESITVTERIDVAPPARCPSPRGLYVAAPHGRPGGRESDPAWIGEDSGQIRSKR